MVRRCGPRVFDESTQPLLFKLERGRQYSEGILDATGNTEREQTKMRDVFAEIEKCGEVKCTGHVNICFISEGAERLDYPLEDKEARRLFISMAKCLESIGMAVEVKIQQKAEPKSQAVADFMRALLHKEPRAHDD